MVMRRTTLTRRAPRPRLDMRRREVDQIQTTLFALIESVGEVTSDDREVVATMRAMLRSGAVRLGGALRDCPIESFLDPEG